jgi:hypothetical protein
VCGQNLIRNYLNSFRRRIIMSKKLIYLVSVVLVLGLVSKVSAELVAHWPLDEGSGTVAHDISGNGLDGTLQGDPQWVVGKIGGALQFDGTGDYIDCGNDPIFDITEQITLTVWVNANDMANSENNMWLGKGDNAYAIKHQTGNYLEFFVYDGSWHSTQYSTNLESLNGEWHHMAGTFDGSELKFYLDGQLEATLAFEGTIGTATHPVTIGENSQESGRFFDGMLDDLRIYNHALTETEILGVMQGGKRYPYALGPVPEDGAWFEQTWGTLSWSPGALAVSHDVYFGDNFDDVNDGAAETFLGNQASTNFIVGFPGFPYPDGLVPGTTYYWRIDEVNDLDPNSPWKGNVWSFWIPPRIAYEPNPADGVKFVDPDMEFSWTAGLGARLHYVYFGDNFTDVNNATVGIPIAFNTYNPGTLELEKFYYWRIDEFDGLATHKGDVWSFRTLPDIAITDPSLVGWWKLDEDMGTTAVDWSGYGNHGTFEGDPQWVPGYDGSALEFDGDDYVDTGNTEDLANWTVTAWVISPEAPSGASPSGPVHREKNYQFNWNHSDDILRGAAALRVGGTWHGASYQPLGANTWYHLTATYDGSALNAYRDGVLITSNPAPSGPPDSESGTLKLGRHATAAQYFTGTVDNVRVYNKALTIEEIKLAMRGDPLVAWGSKPTNGSTVYIRDATPLNWSPGDNASQHDVYFGTDKGAVADADASDMTGIYRGRQGVTIYTPAEGVEWGGGPYFWRVDEYNTDATISKGNVWTFTVTDFIGIDDFEDYNDYPPDEIFSTWIDGWEVPTNGSMAGHPDPPFAETSIVHGGGQSMPLYYDNNFMYSEATMTLVSARDWTEEGVGVLSLWFRGSSDNAAERMYVALNGSATVYHDNPDAALINTWTEWRIDLQEFAAQGVNLTNVNTISIGFGDKSNLQAGGSGMVFFDDIRLYRPAP